MSVLDRHAVTQQGPDDGRPLVFSHGFGCDQSMWRFVAPTFATTHRVVLFDHLGAGRSDLGAFDPARHRSLGGYADDVVELADALDLRDAVFVGHSVSAMIGALATQRSSRFTALAMVAPSPRYVDDGAYRGGFSRDDIDELLAAMDHNYLGWSERMAPVIMGNPDRPELGEELTNSFCRTDPDIARHFARTTFLADNRDDLAGIRVPTLVLQVADDAIAPLEVGRYVRDHVPDATLVVLDTVGHCPHLSAPEATVAALGAWLARLPARR